MITEELLNCVKYNFNDYRTRFAFILSGERVIY